MLPGLSSFPHWLVSSPRCGSQTSQQSCWSSYWKWRRQHCWSFPNNHMRYHCAHLEKIPQAHMQIPRSTLPCSRDLLRSKRSLPSFFVWYSYFDGNFALLHTTEGFVSHSALRWLMSGENQVKLVPVLRSWVSPGDCVGACYWRTRSWNRVCDEGIALEGLGYFCSSFQCRNDPSKWAMTFDQHQLWRWSNREWTVSSSFSVIPLMVIASSWYNLSFASPGDDRIGA